MSSPPQTLADLKLTSVRKHIAQAHPASYFPCLRCNCRFGDRGSLDEHLKGSPYHFRCPKPSCDFDCVSRAHLLDRWRTSGCRHPCKGCDTVCLSERDLGEHLRLVHACELCGEHNGTEGKLDQVCQECLQPPIVGLD